MPSGGQIRIIAGQWRGRKLKVLDSPGLRPTTDRTKETLFNWLMQDVPGARCLDAFAGTGSLGLEALSRHAAHCCFVEKDAKVATQLSDNLQQLQAPAASYQVYQGDTLAWLAQTQERFDLVFVDPPFGQGLAQACIDDLTQHQCLTEDALVYVETEASLADLTVPNHWHLHKTKQTQQVHYRIFRVTRGFAVGD